MQRCRAPCPRSPACPSRSSPAARQTHRRKELALVSGAGALAVLLHGAAMLAYIKLDRDTPARPLKQTVEIELIRPVIIPPMEVEPPPPPPPPPPRKEVPPPPPPVLRQTLPPPAPAPEPEPAPIEEIVAEEVLTIPLQEDPPPPLPPTSTEEPVSEATAYAGYLRNPAPTYPAFAQRQRWEGTVLIRVHVLASGKPDKLEITQSSDARHSTTRRWLRSGTGLSSRPSAAARPSTAGRQYRSNSGFRSNYPWRRSRWTPFFPLPLPSWCTPYCGC